MTITYRRTKSGAWVACGPATQVKPGAMVTVTKRSGERQVEHIESVGRIFQADGVEMRYGYLATNTSSRDGTRNRGRMTISQNLAAAHRASAPSRGGICANCQQPRRSLSECRDSSGLLGMCCPRCASEPDYTRSFA